MQSMKRNSSLQPAFVFVFFVGVSIALRTAATPSSGTAGEREGVRSSNCTIFDTPRVGARTFARITPDGVITEKLLGSERQCLSRATSERLVLEPLGNTLWQVDDVNAIADGVAIDTNDVWG